MDWCLNEIAPEELIGVFRAEGVLGMCAGCNHKELEVVKEKSRGGEYFEVVLCKRREDCQSYAMYNLGEGGVK